MNQETLVLQINKLFDNYNQAAPPAMRDAKIRLLAPQLAQYHSDSLIRAVDKIINDENITYFPTVSQLKGYLRAGINQNKAYLQGCDKCDMSGYFTLWQLRDGKHYAFAYRCDCALGQSYSGMPQIDSQAIPKKVHSRKPPERGF